MADESPASVIVDINGNLVGVVLDGVVYRLQTEAKLAAGTAVVGKVGIDPANTGGLVLDATLVTIRDTAGIKKIVDPVNVSDRSARTLGKVSSVEAGTAVLTNVDASDTSILLLPANGARKGALFYNDPAGGAGSTLFLKLGTTASQTSFTVRLTPNAYYEVPFVYTGQINGIWIAAAGTVRITELT